MSLDDGLLADPAPAAHREDLGDDLGADVVTGEMPEPAVASEAAEPVPAAEPHFANVYVFVRDFLAPMYARHGLTAQSQWHWCPRWWEHPEAVSRLDGLWQVFETLRATPGIGVATWWRDWADPTMNALTDPEGCFRLCGGDTHRLPPSLPLEDAPKGLIEGRGDP